MLEKVMDDESDESERDDGEPGEAPPAELPCECCYPGCILTAKGRDGLCVKHVIALAKGDKDAAEAARQYHAVHDRHEEPKPVRDKLQRHWRQYPSETRKAEGGRRKARSVPVRAYFSQAGTAGSGNDENLPAEQAGAEIAEDKMPAAGDDGGLQGRTENTMKQTDRLGRERGADKTPCPKCGKRLDPRGYSHHVELCKGKKPEPTGPACPGCGRRFENQRGLACHLGHTACGDTAKGTRTPGRPMEIAGTDASASSVSASPRPRVPASSPLSTVHCPLPTAPPDGIAAAGHGLLRLLELLGLAERIADCPDRDGHLFIDTETGRKAIVRPDGEIYAVDLVRRTNAC